MKAIGIFGVGVVGLIALAFASKAKSATVASGSPAKPNPTPAPKPKPKAKPLIDNAPVTGLPPEIAKLIEQANASTDPAFVREVAAQLSEHYTLQAAHLLNYAAILDGSIEPPVPEP